MDNQNEIDDLVGKTIAIEAFLTAIIDTMPVDARGLAGRKLYAQEQAARSALSGESMARKLAFEKTSALLMTRLAAP